MKIPWFSGYSRPHQSFAEGRVFDFEKSRSMENAFLSVWFAPIHQCKHGWYWVILLQFERTELLSFAVSHNQINLTNRLKTNASLRCFQEILKQYLPSLPKLSTVNTANHKQQFHKH